MKDSLIFEWPVRHHLHLMLPVTILLAGMVHAGLFFLFSIIYPRPESARIDSAQVCYIPPGTAEAGRLEGLLRSSDPSVFAPGRGLDLPGFPPPVAYVPRYASDKPTLDLLPRLTNSMRPQFAGPVPVRKDGPVSAGASPFPSRTKLVSSDAFSARIPSLPEGTVFPIPQGFDAEPAVFLIALRENGQIAHVFQQRSSGNSRLDLKAASLLRSLKFSPDPSGASWGFVTYQWGTDVQPVPPR
ncbi:MAG: hypothetical protein WC003_05875 [Terrimicrobiaceae bacterium]